MNETNINWDDLKLFLAVARTGGLSGASQSTGKSPPTLGRRMLQLEAELGKELFIRHARGYQLTSQGLGFFGEVEKLEAQVQPLISLANVRKKVLVKLSAGSWMTSFLC